MNAAESSRFWYLPKCKFYGVEQSANCLELWQAFNVTSPSVRHTHGTIALGMMRGDAVLSHKGTTYSLTDETVVLINADEVHACGAMNTEGYSHCMMYPSVELVQQVVEDLTERSHRFPTFKTPVLSDRRAVQKMMRLQQLIDLSDCPLEQESCLLETLRCLIQAFGEIQEIERSTTSQERFAIQQIKLYLETNYAESITLEQLSQLTYLSPFYLNRVFSQAVGLPPHAYLTQVRIQRSKELLRRGVAIAQVAQAVGFTHQSHLNRHFKRFLHTTPYRYQQMSKNVQDLP